jgi:hypothetical protein
MGEELVRVRYAVYPTREAALAAGYPDAEHGTWQTSPASVRCVEGWIALDVPEPDGDPEAPRRGAY